MKKRYLVDHILRDLDEKMVFIGGARQVGKTCMATYIAQNHFKSSDYMNWLREDLDVAHKTVAKWMDLLERFYYHFRIYPFAHQRIRSLKKEPKLYLWDWSEMTGNDGAKLENVVASHLLKLCHFLNDVDGYKTELYFLRDIDGREVDFLVTDDGKPWFAVEVKSSASDISKTLSYFGSKLDIPFLYQVVDERNVDIRKDRIRMLSMEKFLSSLV